MWCREASFIFTEEPHFLSSVLSALDGVDTMRKYLIKFDDKDYMMVALCSSDSEVQRGQWMVK